MWYKYEIVSTEDGRRFGGIKFSDKGKICVVGGQKSKIRLYREIISYCLSLKRLGVEEKFTQKRKVKFTFRYRGEVIDIVESLNNSRTFILRNVSSLGRIYQ